MVRKGTPSFPAGLGLAAIVIAGCSSAAATSVPTAAAGSTTQPTAAPPAITAAPTVAQATTAAAQDICTPSAAGAGATLPAGTYRFPAPGTPFTMTLPSGYGAQCSGTTLVLFARDGAIALVDGVAQVGPGGAAAVTSAAASVVDRPPHRSASRARSSSPRSARAARS